MPGPSSSCVPWSKTPPGATAPRPLSVRSPSSSGEVKPWTPGKTNHFVATYPRPTRSRAYASPNPLPSPAQGSLPARAGSPLAGRVSHPLDDQQGFMKSSHTPLLLDQPCLVALLPGFQLSESPRMAAGYHYGVKLRITPTGLSPASAAASLAALPPPALPGFLSTMGLSATPTGPACPSRASGWRVPRRRRGFPCCAPLPLPCVPPPLPSELAQRAEPRRNRSVPASLASLPMAAFPGIQAGRLPRCWFRGLFGVHICCGPHGR